jgi:hypothetical protein
MAVSLGAISSRLHESLWVSIDAMSSTFSGVSRLWVFSISIGLIGEFNHVEFAWPQTST